MKTPVKIFLVILCSFFLLYLGLPSPDFPSPPPGSVQSMEEADTETPSRRAYFTDLTREEVMAHYKNQFILKYPYLKPLIAQLNYPPEEAQTLIRDQARSTFLEELVLPMRESVYVNGFEPKEAKDEVWSKGVHYRQKITIRYVYSSPGIRIAVGLATFVVTLLLLQSWRQSFKYEKN
jgi:hypothetical protein